MVHQRKHGLATGTNVCLGPPVSEVPPINQSNAQKMGYEIERTKENYHSTIWGWFPEVNLTAGVSIGAPVRGTDNNRGTRTPEHGGIWPQFSDFHQKHTNDREKSSSRFFWFFALKWPNNGLCGIFWKIFASWYTHFGRPGRFFVHQLWPPAPRRVQKNKKQINK